jgi:hypothetical protein
MSFSTPVVLTQTETFNGSPTAVVELVVEWDLRITTAASYYGRYSVSSSFVTPAAYSDIPGLWCNNVDIEPYGPPVTVSGVDGWEFAKLTITFGVPDLPLNGGSPDPDTVDEKLTIVGETLALPASSWKFSGGTTLDAAKDALPFKTCPQMQYSVSFYYKQDIDPAGFVAYVGKINSSAFGSRSLATGTVMYLGAECDRKIAMGSATTFWHVTHNFAIKADGSTWQQVWNVTSGTWDSITTVVGGKSIYETANLNTILSL